MKIILFHPESDSYMYCHSEDERDALLADEPLLIDVTGDNTHETIAHSKLGPFNEGENIEKNFDMLIEASSKGPIELAPGVTLVSGDALGNFLAGATEELEGVEAQNPRSEAKPCVIDNLQALLHKEGKEVPQDWYFTFGHNHEHRNCYIRIYGTAVSTRNEMFERFGAKWAFQYDTAAFAGQVEAYCLREIQ